MPTNKAGTCEQCGGKTSTPLVKRCRKCWAIRGPEGTPLENPKCRLCGKELNGQNRHRIKGFCRACYDHDRMRAMEVSQGMAPADPPLALHSYEDAWQAWQRWIGIVKERYRGPKKIERSGRQRIVIAGDFHIPFHDAEAVAAMLDREAGADLLIIAGDLQDFYSVSRFTKYQHVPIQTELSAVACFLDQASERFGHVLIVEGNHDQPRFERQLRDRLPLEMVQVIEFLTGGILSPIEVIAKQRANVEIAKRKVDDQTVRWLTQVGDLIVTHAERFSRVPGSTLRTVDEYLSDFQDTYHLQPWRVVAQAHTHQLGWIPWKSDRLLIETGCLCVTHGYQLQPKIAGRPQRRGWVTLEQVNGVTDVASVRPVWFDAMRKTA